MNRFIEKDYIIINKNRFIKSIIFAISTIILFKFIDYVNKPVMYESEDVFYAIFSVGICVILRKLGDIKNNYLFILLMAMYHLVAIQNVMKLVNIYLYSINSFMVGQIEENAVVLFAACFLLYICRKGNEEIDIHYLYYIYSIIFTFIGVLFLSKTVFYKLNLIFLSIVCFYFIFSFYRSNSIVKNIVYKETVNIVSVFFCLLLLAVILNFTMIFVNDKYEIVKYSFDFIFHLIFIIESTTILFNTINKPFKAILENLYIKNKQLDNINQQVFRQNVFLEYSRELIDSKNKRLNTFFYKLPLPIVIINKDSERIRFCNNKFLELMEVKQYRQIINKKIFSLFKIEDNKFIKDLNSVIRGIINKNGKKKYVDIEFYYDELNEDVIVIFTEVTEQVKMIEIKEKIKNKEFEEQMKSDFLSNISHDLKTPINVIYTAVQLMDIYCDKENEEGISKYIDVCKSNCKILIKLTDSLINKSKNFSFSSDIKLKVVNIVPIIKQYVNSLKEYAKTKNVNITFQSSENIIYAEVDVDCIERIVQNIISNSLKYYGENGKIDVYILGMDNNFKIIFKDNGIGMDDETLRNVFKRYSVGENTCNIREKSTGIGLSIVKKMVNKQNGKINIYSKPNVGTKVEIIFKRVKKNE